MPEDIKFDETILKAMQTFEGLSFEEAKLSYAKRQKLPSTAFCGPKRTYPAHDAAHVRNALARLSQFGSRLKKGVRARVLSCLKRRAKRFNVEISESVSGRLCLLKYDETLDPKLREKWQIEVEESVSWCEEKYKESE